MGTGGPGIGSPCGLPQPLPSPSQIALHLLGDHWSVEVWLPQDFPCPSVTPLGPRGELVGGGEPAGGRNAGSLRLLSRRSESLVGAGHEAWGPGHGAPPPEGHPHPLEGTRALPKAGCPHTPTSVQAPEARTPPVTCESPPRTPLPAVRRPLPFAASFLPPFHQGDVAKPQLESSLGIDAHAHVLGHLWPRPCPRGRHWGWARRGEGAGRGGAAPGQELLSGEGRREHGAPGRCRCQAFRRGVPGS